MVSRRGEFLGAFDEVTVLEASTGPAAVVNRVLSVVAVADSRPPTRLAA
ncbi:hypothetical protein AB0N81_31195 [Streptomyces sp. NPDC093510]